MPEQRKSHVSPNGPQLDYFLQNKHQIFRTMKTHNYLLKTLTCEPASQAQIHTMPLDYTLHIQTHQDYIGGMDHPICNHN
jgi:hypothetical protein